MIALEFRLLGPLDVRCKGRQLPKPPTLNSQSLLAYIWSSVASGPSLGSGWPRCTGAILDLPASHPPLQPR